VRSRANAWAAFCFLLFFTIEPGLAAPSQPITKEQVDAAVTQLRTDANLGTKRKAHRLRRVSSDDTANHDPSNWLEWLGQAIEWFASTARALLWVIGVVVVGIVALFIKRYLTTRVARPAKLTVTMPTHVRDLDIRPESLPDDIPTAAQELWDRGELRAALSLLYRGALSRLAHVHKVPIPDSSTEGDCLELANTHLPASQAAYVARLIRVWQRAVYGNTNPTSEEFQSLCAGFAVSLDNPTVIPTEQAA
jgi:hypothetical protein